MSNATWQIVSKKEPHWETVSERKSEREIFELSVTAESEHRSGTVHQWRGMIEIDESGVQHLKYMLLDGSEHVDGSTALPKIDIHKLITREENPAAAFEKVARTCDEYTQWMEKNLVAHEEKERRDQESVSATTLCLQQLAAEGIHPGGSLG